MPLFVLWCDHDRVMHPSGVEVIQRALPSASVKVMKGCGHLPHTERPDEAGRLYHEFLSDLRVKAEEHKG
jgi:pimeloyl-ACP methyl ester carboxylesterase